MICSRCFAYCSAFRRFFFSFSVISFDSLYVGITTQIFIFCQIQNFLNIYHCSGYFFSPKINLALVGPFRGKNKFERILKYKFIIMQETKP
jgi:hypothetical protein